MFLPLLRFPVVPSVLALVVWFVPQDAPAADPGIDFFEQKIRPLLVTRCEGCHSSVTGKTSGGLALDTRQGWANGGDNGPAIVPGKPEESLLLQAISYTDPDLHMPPAGKGERLTADEVAAVAAWIKAGAVDPRVAGERLGGMSADEARRWWSWQPLKPVAVPEVRESTWPQTDLDRFILAAQEREGLPHAGPADRRTLIRRVTFNLTGLPPTPAEIRDFLADDQPGAFDRVIDRLLASEAYGERWGRHWLDVARYADTAGDGADYPVREAFRYRDWVVRAFQKDLPFDEFLKLQIAGDLLAPARPAEEYADCITATGFLAVGKRYGYAPNPDYQHLDFADVIDSVGRSLLGLSLGCARCHDHKYDPVSMRDYYGLYGILQSTRWAFPGGEEHKRPTHFPPLVPAAEVARLEAERAATVARLESELATLQASRGKLDGNWIAGGPDLALESQPDGKPPAAPWLSAGPNAVGPESQSPFAHIHTPGQRGVRVGSGQPTDGIRYVFPQKLKKTPGGKFHLTVDFRTVAGADQPGAYRFYLGRGVIESLALEVSVTRQELALKNGTDWEVIRPIEPGVWHTLQATLDPDQRTWSGVVGPAGDLTEFGNKKLNPAWDGILDTFICDGIGHVAGPAPARDIDNLGLQAVFFPPPGSDPVPAFVPPADAPAQLARLAEQIKQLTAERDAVQAREIYPMAYGVSEGTATNAKLQKRGEPAQPGEEIPRQYLTILGGDLLPEGTPGSGRLQLAEWLTRSQQPLAARVFVNRVWGWHFGQGLVTTASDFGSRGELPSHPELLEWLTGQFLQSGGSLKALQRLILRSAVYQQGSDDLPEGLARDPGNRWLWRHPRQPLDAESIRDAMLFVSGRLERGPAGPHPFPPTPTWAFTIHQPFHAVYDSNHRSLYLMQQRNRRHPFLALFDSADPNQSVAQRLPTVTPTQTLYLMNSPFVHEQAAAFAARSALPGLSDSERARQMIEATHGREPDSAELELAGQFIAQYATRLPAETTAADRETAAWQAFARVLLTGNAFLSVD
jgi:hypothetical protein